MADPPERDPVRVDVGLGSQEVDHRGDHLLPVVAERHVAFEQHRLLPGPVEDQHVVAAGHPASPQRRPQGGDRAVATVVEDHGGTWLSPRIGSEEVAGQAGPGIGNLHLLARGVHPGHMGVKAAPVRPEGPQQQRLGVLGAVHRRQRQPVVGAGPQVRRPGADLMATVGAAVGDRLDPLGGGDPLLAPAVGVAADDPVGGGQQLADVAAAVPDAAERQLGLEVQLLGLEELVGHWVHL
jgi:hypothetical protein